MPVNGGSQSFVPLRFSRNFSQRLDYPLLFGLNKLVNSMLGDFSRCDNLDFTGCHDNSRLRGSWTAPNVIGK